MPSCSNRFLDMVKLKWLLDSGNEKIEIFCNVKKCFTY